MIELPVVKASDSRMNRHGAEHQITISSARRDRCIAEIAAAARNSSAKSRSDTASSELAVGRSKPSASRGHRAIDRKRRAGQRRAAQRALVQPAAAVGKPPTVAVQHLDIGQQMVAERHRLRGLQMGEAGHRIRGMRRGTVGQRAHHVGDLRRSARRSRRAPRGGNPSPPGRCGCARCAAGGRPRRCARSGGPRCSCGCLPAPHRTGSVRSRSRARSLLDRSGWPAHPLPR